MADIFEIRDNLNDKYRHMLKDLYNDEPFIIIEEVYGTIFMTIDFDTLYGNNKLSDIWSTDILYLFFIANLEIFNSLIQYKVRMTIKFRKHTYSGSSIPRRSAHIKKEVLENYEKLFLY